MTSLPPEPADDSLVAQAEKSCAELERKVSSNSIDLLQVGFRHSLLDGGDDDDEMMMMTMTMMMMMMMMRMMMRRRRRSRI